MKKAKNHKKLSDTWGFRLALGVPLLGALTLWWAIYASSDFGSLCFHAECVNTWLENFKAPLAVAGLALPIVAMVAALHRSEEAFFQMEEVVNNNRFSNYLKHREMFDGLIDSYCKSTQVSNGRKLQVSSWGLYPSIYPQNGFNNPNWSAEIHKNSSLLKIDLRIGLIVSQLRSSPDDLNVEVFMTEVSHLCGMLLLVYEPFIWLVHEKDEVIVRLPLCDKSEALFGLSRLLFDLFVIYGIIKDYAHEKHDLLHGIYSDPNYWGNLSIIAGQSKIKMPRHRLLDELEATAD